MIYWTLFPGVNLTAKWTEIIAAPGLYANFREDRTGRFVLLSFLSCPLSLLVLLLHRPQPKS